MLLETVDYGLDAILQLDIVQTAVSEAGVKALHDLLSVRL